MKTMKINQNIFKAYDVRGIYPEEINEGTAGRIAKAFAKFLSPKTVVLGHDMRESSRNLHKSCIEGLVSMGADVLDIGLTSTPMLYYAVPHLKADGGIMVTASHNQMNYGGLKFIDAESAPIFIETGLKEIKKIAKDEITDLPEKGELIKIDVLDDYVVFLKNDGLNFKNLKIVIDEMHGSMGPLTKKVFEGSGIELICLSCDPDEDIPGYETPNPSLEENRGRIEKAISKNKADMGIMFDGDGDRVVLVDSRGLLVSPNFMAAMIAKEVLAESKGAKIVGDVRASHAIPDIVRESGGEFFVAKAGNPYIKNKMREENAAFGFETSGHMMFKKTNYAEDSITGAIYVLKYLSHTDKLPQEIFDEFKSKYFIALESNYKTQDENILDKVEVKYKNGSVTKLGGLTIAFPGYWFNIRKSNTEPLIRLNMEANSKEILEERKKELTDFLLKNGCSLAD